MNGFDKIRHIRLSEDVFHNVGRKATALNVTCHDLVNYLVQQQLAGPQETPAVPAVTAHKDLNTYYFLDQETLQSLNRAAAKAKASPCALASAFIVAGLARLDADADAGQMMPVIPAAFTVQHRPCA